MEYEALRVIAQNRGLQLDILRAIDTHLDAPLHVSRATNGVGIVIPLTVDAFEVLACSPALGEALLLGPLAALRDYMQWAVIEWVSAEVLSVTDCAPSLDMHLPATGSPMFADTVKHWPAAVTQALAAKTLPLTVSVLIQRIPSALQHVLAGAVSPYSLHTTHGESEDTHQKRPPSPVCDTFLEEAHRVRFVGIVHEVFYASRGDTLPAPWLTLLLCRGSTSSTSEEAVLSPQRTRLTVCISDMDEAVQQAVAIIGCLVEVCGELVVGRTQQSATAATAAPIMPREYLHAQHVAPVLTRGQLALQQLAEAAAAGAELGNTSPVVSTAHILPHEPFAWNGGQMDIGNINTEGALSDADENAAAIFAVRLWEGCRLSWGVEDAPPPCSRGDQWCSDFFAASFDAIVSVLVTLFSAQSVDEEGVSTIVFDEAAVSTPPWVPRALKRVERATPTALLSLPASVVSRSKPAFFLPQYSSHEKQPHASAQRRAAGTVPPRHAEVIRGGALSHAHRRVLFLPQIEMAASDTLRSLQHSLTHNTPDSSAQRREGNHPGEEEDPSRVVNRVGGQRVPYRVTHAVICTVRQTGEVLRNTALFEFMQRADVVVRPFIDAHRKMQALYGYTDDRMQTLLRERSAVWSRIISAALALPHSELLKSNNNNNNHARHPLLSCWMYATPTLTTACGLLLRTFFMAAKALCGDAVDASMMATLVRLTCHHASMRARCAAFYLREVILTTNCSVPEESRIGSPPMTALVDALAAIGLCDATLHFFTGKTVLGTCVLEVLQTEVNAAVMSAVGEEELFDTTHGTEDGDAELLQFLEFLSATTAVSVNSSSEGESDAFSVASIVSDLNRHLASVINSANATE